MRIGLVELPAIKLCDQHGRNWTAFRHHEPLVSKQILLAQLRGLGFDAALVNLKSSGAEHTFGEVSWRDLSLQEDLCRQQHRRVSGRCLRSLGLHHQLYAGT